MSPLALTFKSLRNRRVTVLLTVVSLALGVALLLGVERIRHEARTGFTNTISGTDLVVGARTGEVSLLLSSVFHIGNPTQNISWQTYRKIADNPQVAWTIPLSLGDSHRGYRVIGTSADYFKHYRYADQRSLEIARGDIFHDTYDAVLGAEVARKFDYRIDDEIVLAHGAGEVSFVDHADKPFRVAGILAPTGTPVDRAVHVSLAGIEAVHADWEGGVHVDCAHHDHEHEGHHDGKHLQTEEASRGPIGEDGAGEEDRLAAIEALLAGRDLGPPEPTQVSAFLVGMHSRPNAVFLQRSINTYDGEALSAVMPGVALQELWQVVGVVEKTLRVVSLFVIAVSLAGMLSVLMTSLNERRREMAILRSVGARPGHIISLVAGEALFVTALASLLGTALLYGLIAVARPIALSQAGVRLGYSIPSFGEFILIGAVLGIGLLVGLIPAWRCYRGSLADGLTIRT